MALSGFKFASLFTLGASGSSHRYLTEKVTLPAFFPFARCAIESAMSAYALTGIPVWATLGNERFGLVSVPDSVTELHLFVDHDAGGELAASRGLAAYAREGRTIHVRKPSSRDTDWNDELTAWLRRKATR